VSTPFDIAKLSVAICGPLTAAAPGGDGSSVAAA
jgi:hypothetical protein